MNFRFHSRRTLLVLALTLTSMLALSSAPASAKVVHSFKFAVNGSATPGGSWGGEPGPVVPAGSPAGSFYVGSYGFHVYDRFSSTGAYECQITGAGGSSTSTSECDKSGPSLPGGEFETVEPGGVFDSSTGTLYIGAPSGVVRAFSEAGEYEPSKDFTAPGNVSQLAVDASTGDVYIASNTYNPSTEKEEEFVYKYDPSTETVSTFATETSGGALNQVNGVAVDNDASSPSYRDVYVDNGNNGVAVFSSSGSYLRSITSTPKGSLNASNGLATDPTDGNLYVLEYSRAINEFDPSGAFVYSFGAEVYPAEYPPANGYIAVAHVAVNPSTGELYVGDWFHNVVDVLSGDEVLADVTTEAATDVAPTSDTLNGTVNPHGVAITHCYFEYVKDAEYEPTAANPYSNGQTVACEETVGSGTSPVAVEAKVSGLQAGSIYDFRLVAENNNSVTAGPSDGANQVVGPPALRERSASLIGQTSATLNAGVNPDGAATTYHFEYGEPGGAEGVYGHSAPATDASIGSGIAEVGVSQAVPGLQPQTIYHFRVVATNSAGTVNGPDQTFETLTPALVDVLMPAEITATNATLQVYLNPQGQETSYHFEYGTEETYGHSTPSASAGSGDEPTLDSATVSGLQPDTTYHFRTVATNSFGTVEGPDATFTTPPATCPNEKVRTGFSARLPNCRAYEQVSPVNKDGNGAQTTAVSPSGERAVVQLAGSGLPGAQSAPVFDTYLSERGSGRLEHGLGGSTGAYREVSSDHLGHQHRT